MDGWIEGEGKVRGAVGIVRHVMHFGTLDLRMVMEFELLLCE